MGVCPPLINGPDPFGACAHVGRVSTGVAVRSALPRLSALLPRVLRERVVRKLLRLPALHSSCALPEAVRDDKRDGTGEGDGVGVNPRPSFSAWVLLITRSTLSSDCCLSSWAAVVPTFRICSSIPPYGRL